VSISGVWVTTAGLVLCGKVEVREMGEMGSPAGEAVVVGGREVADTVRGGEGMGCVFGIFGDLVLCRDMIDRC
jgi:hypothetical protein